MQKYWLFLGIIAVVIFATMGVNASLRPATLSVVGVGMTTVAPQQVSLIVSKVNTSPIAPAAIEEGKRDINALIETTRQLVQDPTVEIKQSFYNVTQGINNQYVVANAYSVKTNNVPGVDNLVKTLYQQGATTVSNISFTTSNQPTNEQEVRIQAFTDAKTQAENIAKAAGKRLGKLVSIQDDNSGASSTVQSGTDISIVKRVAAVYEVW